MYIATVSVEAGHGAHRPLERHQVGDHLDDLDRRGVRVRPARELVQVVADARDLATELALDDRADAVHVRVRTIACRSSADGDRPAAAVFPDGARRLVDFPVM